MCMHCLKPVKQLGWISVKGGFQDLPDSSKAKHYETDDSKTNNFHSL